MRWVTAEDLKFWAARTDARLLTPYLVRRLIEASAAKIRSLEFPVAEGTQRSGFDGVADVDSDAEFVPNSVSVWEVSAESNVPGKAVDDFNERSVGALPETLPDGLDRLRVTYVGVSVRPWPKTRKGGKQKKKAKAPKGPLDVATIGTLNDFVLAAKRMAIWQDVRMLDAYVLERWLEKNRAVGAWAARLIGKVHGDARDFEDEWQLLNAQAGPVPWTSDLLLAGRAQQGQEMLGKLLGPPSVSTIRADSVDESVAFVIANVMALAAGHSDRERILARGLVIRDPTEASDLTSSEPLILILRDEAARLAPALAAKGHTCVAAIGRAALQAGGSVLHVRRSPRDAFVQALLKGGFSLEVAFQHARDCNGSVTVLRRRTGVAHDRPHWAEQTSLAELAPAALIGMFDLDSDGDRECLGELAGRDADEYVRALRKYLAPEVDPPILNVASQWSLYAPADILTLAFELRIIDKDLLERFAAVAIKVLGERDATLALPPSERPYAPIRGIKRRYTSTLREGLSESLRLLSANLEGLQREVGHSGQKWLDDLVCRCPGISDDPFALASMRSMLPAVAEAAPLIFLDALEALLQGHSRVLQGMLFDESENVLSAGGTFTLFTGALEVCAWHSEHTSRVLDLLLELSELDPGGRISNRPIASLAEYFLPWRPATNASISIRTQQLGRVLKRASERTGGDLIRRLLPGRTQSAMGFQTPLWRAYDAGDPPTIADLLKAQQDVVARSIARAGRDPVLWQELVDCLTSCYAEQRDQILAALESLEFEGSNRVDFWQLLRKETARNQRFADTEWALRGDDLERMRKLVQGLAPEVLFERHRWLFDDGWPDVELVEADDDDDERARVRLRKSALKEILDAGGEAAVLEFARVVKAPGTLTKPILEIVSADVLMRLAVEAATSFEDLHFASCLSVAGTATHGEAWGECLLSNTRDLAADRRAALLKLWDDNAALLRLVAAQGAEVERSYWSMRPSWLTTKEAAVRETILDRMLAVGRGLDVASYLAAHKSESSTQLLLKAVQVSLAGLQVDPERVAGGNVGYYLSEIVRELSKRDDAREDELIQLEFTFLRQLIGVGRRGPGQLAIHRQMARSPKFFVELMAVVFRSEKESTPAPIADERAREHAMQCYRLIESFTLAANSSGSQILLEVPDALREWVGEVRQLAEAGGRRILTELQLGKIFASSAADPGDQLRPHRQVRQVIEGFHTEEVERGFVMEIYNLRGVYSRQIDEGGAQEHALADKWTETARGLAQWPHTAAIARKVSEMWRAHAEDEDMRRDKRRARGR